MLLQHDNLRPLFAMLLYFHHCQPTINAVAPQESSDNYSDSSAVMHPQFLTASRFHGVSTNGAYKRSFLMHKVVVLHTSTVSAVSRMSVKCCSRVSAFIQQVSSMDVCVHVFALGNLLIHCFTFSNLFIL